MAYNTLYFCKDKPYVVNLRPVNRLKIPTELTDKMIMNKTIFHNLTLVLLIAVVSTAAFSQDSEGLSPIADAGSSRYAAQKPVVLDGSGSYDPDSSGPLSYTWRQIAGPPVVIVDANTATPTIGGSFQPGTGRDTTPVLGGFSQTDGIQECEFELVVSDGEFESLPDTVKVVVVPYFGESTLNLENDSFDPNRPTSVSFFGGIDCSTGMTVPPSMVGEVPDWLHANVIDFFSGYQARTEGGMRTFFHYGDMLIVYLSSIAPDYKQMIQTIGWSAGGQPALDVAVQLNRTYIDARYAVNRVTLIDSGYCLQQPEKIEVLLNNPVDGEIFWVDSYLGENNIFFPNVLNVDSSLSHMEIMEWYGSSLVTQNAHDFNGGVVAGMYWSIAGPGRNLQLALTPGEQTYKYKWLGSKSSGYMDFYDEQQYPARLPEPVTLIGPEDCAFVDANGAVFSCEESENAVGYQLLFGSDPYRVMDYYIISDTPDPPTEVVTASFFEQTWWTIKARDQYGSTIYADPILVSFENLEPPPIENITIGKEYSSIQRAIDDARNGDEIVVRPGVYQGKINFKGKNLTLRSTDPNDPAVITETILIAYGDVVTFSNGEDANCVLAGFTIADSDNGIYCSAASPTITNCNIVDNVSAGMKLYMASKPTISKCIIAGNGGSGLDMYTFTAGRYILINSPTIVNCTIAGNSKIGISEGMPTVLNSIIYGNGVQITGSSAIVTYSNVQGGYSGEGNIDADPFFADPDNGDYHLKSQAGRWNPASQSWVTDEVSSACVDAGDPSTPLGLEPSNNGGVINMGAYGGTLEASKSP